MKPLSSPAQPTALQTLSLVARTTHAFQDQKGRRVTCLEGQVWITQDGDTRDIVLSAGDCFTLDRQGLALAFALKDALVLVGQPDGAAPC